MNFRPAQTFGYLPVNVPGAIEVSAQYFRIFRWHVVRYLRRHPLLGLLNILSVALGVSVYLATQIANHSANRAFSATVDLVAGKAELEITAPAGHLPETVFPLTAAAPGVSAATPLVQGFVALRDFPGDYLEILGIDIFTNGPFRTFDPSNFGAGEFDLPRWLGRPGSIAVSEEFVQQHHLKAGDKIRVRIGTDDRDLEIGFLLRKEDTFDPHFAAMDIGWAQELLGRRGELSVIQLKLVNPGEREAVIAALRQSLPKDVRIAPPARRTEEVDKMLGGFELNLTMMSLVSVLVGMFLIYNTVSASVVRRQHEIGILRSLGVTRNEIRSLFLGEAVVLGAIGSILGLIGGLVLARVLVGAVSQTISSLYVLVSVREIALRPWTFVLAWLIGVGSVIASAWFPANVGRASGPGRGAPWRHPAGAIGGSIARLVDRRDSLRFSRGDLFVFCAFHWPTVAQFRSGIFRRSRFLISSPAGHVSFQSSGGEISPSFPSATAESEN